MATAPELQLPVCSIDQRGGAPNDSIGTEWPSYAGVLPTNQSESGATIGKI